MIATLHEPLDRRLLHGVSWNAYEHMLQKFENIGACVSPTIGGSLKS
ncbi:MAG: hypothetical protein HY289_05055 [Planctomycetes bacterium]|nr:hypothetical protein [Planctomycetota bacterium]